MHITNNKMPLKVLFLPKYTSKAPSSRYRTFQYLDRFQEKGIVFRVEPLFDDNYINNLYGGKRVNYMGIILSYLKRVCALIQAKRFDFLYIEKEAFPYMPYVFEKLLINQRYILDFDDAIFQNYIDHPNMVVRNCFSTKLDNLIANAQAIVTGSPFLTEYCLRYNNNVIEIPTSVNWEKYSELPEVAKGDSDFVIGWIGSPSTSKYILNVVEPLRSFLSMYPTAKLRLVGFNPDIPLDLPKNRVEIISWRESEEVRLICSFDVGIMPLDADMFSRGKCGFKLIQYMSCAIPTISTPLEANVKINNGSDNLFAGPSQEWLTCLQKVFSNRSYYKLVGQKNRDIAFRRYSVQSNTEAYINLFKFRERGTYPL